jgi:hypothetical protein
VLNAQRRSGLSIPQFCAERGISRWLFYQWLRRLRSGPEKKRRDLVKVEVTEFPAPSPAPAEPLRMVFQNGITLHFVEKPAPEWIMELMRLAS